MIACDCIVLDRTRTGVRRKLRLAAVFLGALPSVSNLLLYFLYPPSSINRSHSRRVRATRTPASNTLILVICRQKPSVITAMCGARGGLFRVPLLHLSQDSSVVSEDFSRDS